MLRMLWIAKCVIKKDEKALYREDIRFVSKVWKVAFILFFFLSSVSAILLRTSYDTIFKIMVVLSIVDIIVLIITWNMEFKVYKLVQQKENNEQLERSSLIFNELIRGIENRTWGKCIQFRGASNIEIS